MCENTMIISYLNVSKSGEEKGIDNSTFKITFKKELLYAH